MRDLKRNQRQIWYAVPTGSREILDEWGNTTLEEETIFLPPVPLMANVSANVGQEAVQVFGAVTEYTRTISLSGESCPLLEGCKVWFQTDVEGDANYTVAKVADSKNGFLIALRELKRHG